MMQAAAIDGAAVHVVLILLFVLVGGVFAATEIALVSLREGQIRQLERRGGRGARTAALARNPNRFLSAVQIGVTVAGFLSAAYGASTISPPIASTFVGWGLPPGLASGAALVGTTLMIAYLSLILGELVPKRIALQRSTEVSLLTAPALDRFATAMRPVIWFLSVSTDMLVRLVGADPKMKTEAVTPEELRDLLVGHTALAEPQRHILSEAFDAGQRSLVEVMRPRTDVDFLAADTPLIQARDEALKRGHSRYPVTATSFDDIVGFVHLRDLLLADENQVATVRELCRPVLRLPVSKPALAALSDMQRNNLQMSIVVDEYGGTAGMVTLEDIVEEIVGEFGDEYDEPTHPVTASSRRYLPQQQVDGLLIIEDFESTTGIALPEGPYETVAGFVLHELQRMPRLGDSITFEDHQLTITALDGRRISRVRVTHPRPTPDPHHTIDSE